MTGTSTTTGWRPTRHHDTCDTCDRRPGSWYATFDDGVVFRVCDDCVALVDNRVTVVRSAPTNEGTSP